MLMMLPYVAIIIIMVIIVIATNDAGSPRYGLWVKGVRGLKSGLWMAALRGNFGLSESRRGGCTSFWGEK